MKKKLLSVLTALAMCLSLLPTAVLASDCENCADADGDYYCDVCWEVLEHECVNEDDDWFCDICSAVLEHDCVDENNDHWCDRCMETVSECADEDHDHFCDRCGELFYHIDDDSTCEVEGCDACEVSLSGTYLELSYRTDEDDESVADGKVEISAFIYDIDKWINNEPFDPAAGSVSVVWKDTKTIYDDELDAFVDVTTKYPSQSGALTVDENGKAVAVFAGIPIDALSHANLVFEPADPEKCLPANNGLMIEYEENAFKLDVDAKVDIAINSVKEYDLYFLAGTEITVAMVEEAEGTCAWMFDEDETVPEYEENGASITFVMPEGEVYLTFEFVCAECVDVDCDHWCDVCRSGLSECSDEDGDHYCDWCFELLSNLCNDSDGDHVCDVCYTYMDWLCTDEDEDHVCDVCWNVLTWLCKDRNNDHYCDEDSCGAQVSECEDADEDNICDVCGEGIYPHSWNLDVDAETGDAQITVTWSPVAEQVGNDALDKYIVYIFETENQSYEEAEKVEFSPEECPFVYTFSGLTNDAEYEIGVEVYYTIVEDGNNLPHHLSSAAYGVPVSSSATVPGMPEIQSITYDDGSITVNWIAPADNGGALVREYAVEVTRENWGVSVGLHADEFGDSETMSWTVDDLTNGESYTVRVYAINAVGESEPAQTEAVIPLIPYEITVGGVRITEENMNDVLEDGTVYFDSDERVLTLDNTDIGVTEGNYGIHTRVDLTIELVGENKVSCTGYYGLLARKALTICGEGSLEISGSDFGIYTIGYPDATLTVCDSAAVNASAGDVISGGSFGIRADGVFTACDDAVVNAMAGKAPGRSCGIYAYTRLNVEDNARVTTTGDQAQNDSYGIRTTDITVSGGELTAIGGEGVYMNNGIFTQGMEILGGAVTATAGTTTSGPSVGLHVSNQLTVSGSDTSVTATGGDAPGDASCGIYVGDVMTVDGGVITANSGASGYTYGMEVFELIVSDGSVNGQAGEADTEEGYSWGIQASNGLTVSGGSVTGIGGQAGSYSYGVQATGGANISGGTVKAVCGTAQKQFALWAFEEMSLSGGLSILVPAQGKLDNSGEWYWTVSDAAGNVASNVEIGTPDVVGGGGGSSAPVYKPNVEDAENGAVTVAPKYPNKGDKVTIKTTPEEGYVVSDVIVTDKKGNEVEITDHGDGTFSFVQPIGKVNISVSFEPERCASENYSDLDAEAWYHDAVDFVLKRGLMTGVSEDTFAPGMATDRAMIVTILWALENKPVVSDPMSFDDVAAESWYTEAVRWAASEGIVSGYGDGAFGAEDSITREQLATILYSYEKYKGGGFVGAWMFRLNYPDVADISEWAYEPMCWMTMKGIMSGKDGGILDPKGIATRAETAQMLMKFICNQDA